MSPSELTLLDFKNILEWYERLPEESQNIAKYERSQEKIKGLFSIHEDYAEPLVDNLIDATLSDLESHTSDELKSARSLLQNRQYRLEIKSKKIKEMFDCETSRLKAQMTHIEFKLEEQKQMIEKKIDENKMDINNISFAIKRIDEQLSGENQ